MKFQTLQWLSVALILGIGLIHLSMVPAEYEEAQYMGLLFAINFLAAIIAALGILRREVWGWVLGLVIAAGSIIGYILSRTVGLPGMEIEAWLQPMGLLSLIVEGIFFVLVIMMKPWADLAHTK